MGLYHPLDGVTNLKYKLLYSGMGEMENIGNIEIEKYQIGF